MSFHAASRVNSWSDIVIETLYLVFGIVFPGDHPSYLGV